MENNSFNNANNSNNSNNPNNLNGFFYNGNSNTFFNPNNINVNQINNVGNINNVNNINNINGQNQVFGYANFPNNQVQLPNGYYQNGHKQNSNVYASFSTGVGIQTPNANIPYLNNLKNGISSGITTYVTSNKKSRDVFDTTKKQNSKKYKVMQSISSTSKVVFLISLFAVSFVIASYYLVSYLTKSEAVEQIPLVEFEENYAPLNMASIISQNMNIDNFKETVNEQRVIAFPIKYVTNDKLPEGEEQVKTEGKDGSSRILSVRTYEKGDVVDENIIEENVIESPITQEIYIGTSKYLKQYQVHLGETMYSLVDTTIYSKPELTSPSVGVIPATYDLTLVDIDTDFIKVKYDTFEGYVEKSKITSAALAPEMVEKARYRRLVKDVSIDMPLNKKSGLSLSDFKKICSNNPLDTNKIFEQNYEAFYNIEQKYNINGVFLIALAIHESGWGTSQISVDKKNLFGYGSYDRDPYNMSYSFNTYEEGIELVAKVLQKSYLNPKDTKIYNDELATGQYYNGSNVKGVNTKYSTDSNWYIKVYKYIATLYNKLDDSKQIQAAPVPEIQTQLPATNTTSTSNTATTSTNTINVNTNTTTNSTRN